MGEIQNIVMIGAGNVATHLGYALKKAGFDILQVYSRKQEHAEKLATGLQSGWINELHGILHGADLYIIAVADDVVGDVAGKISAADKFVVHTSGSVSMETLQPFTSDYGVIYPVQTFSGSEKMDFNLIPVCIEANSVKNLERLNLLVSRISDDVRTIPSDQRRVLHLAAVFACNFPNLMYSIADSLLRGVNLDFSLLKPLILETAKKVQSASPAETQTGPAWRGDQNVMDSHLGILKNNPAARELYRMLSGEIVRMKKLH